MFRFRKARTGHDTSDASDNVVLNESEGVGPTGCMAVLPDGDTVVISPGSAQIAEVYSVAAGKRLRVLEGHQDSISCVAVLAEDIVVSTAWDRTVRVWRVSTAELLHTQKVQETPRRVVALRAGIFVVSDDKCVLSEMRWTGTSVWPSVRAPTRVGDSHSGHITAIVAAHDRLATMTREGIVSVLNYSSYQCVTTLGCPSEKKFCAAISLSERWLAFPDRYAKAVLVYDAETFELKHRLPISISPAHPQTIELSSDNEHLLAVELNKVAVYKIGTGQCVWSTEAKGVLAASILPGGRVLAASPKRPVEVLGLPSYATATIVPSQQLVTIQPLPPLQDAFASALAANITSTSDCCRLIIEENCCASVAEWYSAHQLLMLATRDADLPRTIDYAGKKSWWFHQLYITARNFSLSAEDEVVVRNCLREAKLVGVIEGEQAVLGVLKIAEDMRTELTLVQTAVVKLCSKVLETETAVAKLKKSFKSYAKTQRVSSLVGIGLQLLPLVGGAAAGMVWAGASIVEGLECQYVVEEGLGFAVTASQNKVISFTERLLSTLRKNLSKQQIAKLDSDHRKRLEELVEECGFSLERLSHLLEEAHKEVIRDFKETSERSMSEVKTDTGPTNRSENEGATTFPCEVTDLSEHAEPDSSSRSNLSYDMNSISGDHTRPDASNTCIRASAAMRQRLQARAFRGACSADCDYQHIREDQVVEENDGLVQDQVQALLNRLQASQEQVQTLLTQVKEAVREAQASRKQEQALTKQIITLRQDNSQLKRVIQRLLQEDGNV